MVEPGGPADPELWSRRLGALATLIPADAVAVLLPLADGRYIPFASHGLRPDTELGDVLRLVKSATTERATPRSGALAIPLADGRSAEAALATPLVWNEHVVGALAALRVGAPFTADDAAAATRIAPLLALELAAASRAQRATQHPDAERLRRAEQDRQHAIALYEVGKVIAGASDRVAGTDRAAAILAEALRNDVVAIWDHDSDGTLRPLAWRGVDSATLATRTDADSALTRAVLERRPQVAQLRSGASWAGAATDVVVTPIASDGRISGILLLGRTGRGYAESEVTLAASLAETLAALPRAGPAVTVWHHDQSAVAQRPETVESPDPMAFIANAPRAALEPPDDQRRPAPVLLIGLAALLAAALAVTAALGVGGPLLYVVAASVALSAGWAALGSGLGQQFLLLSALVAFVERASAPVIAGVTSSDALIAAAGGAVLAVATAGVAASVLRRGR